MQLQFYKIMNGEAEPAHLKPVPYGELDSYLWGDRVLEGVIFRFEVTPQRDGLSAHVPNMEQNKYLQRVVTKAAVEDGIRIAMGHDIFDRDVILYDHDKPFSEQNAHFAVEPIFQRE